MTLKHFSAALAACVLLTTPAAHAGILEELLALPSIQKLLARTSDIQSTLQKCADGGYKQINAKLCQDAEAALRLSRVPPELRAVLSSPKGSASLRDLCLGVQATPAQDTYLCAELMEGDPVFKQQALAERNTRAQRKIQAGAESPR